MKCGGGQGGCIGGMPRETDLKRCSERLHAIRPEGPKLC